MSDSCDPRDCSLSGSSVHGNSQARISEWVAFFFSRRSSQLRDWTWVSCTAGSFFTDWATREALLQKAKGKVTQSCLTLCNPMDYTVCGILQARILEWVAFPFSRESFQPRDWTQVFCIADRSFTSWATREAHCRRHPLQTGSKTWSPNTSTYGSRVFTWLMAVRVGTSLF